MTSTKNKAKDSTNHNFKSKLNIKSLKTSNQNKHKPKK